MDTRQTKITLKEIQEILPTFSRPEILELDRKIHECLETLETLTFSKAAETAFSDWNDPEEGIYDED